MRKRGPKDRRLFNTVARRRRRKIAALAWSTVETSLGERSRSSTARGTPPGSGLNQVRLMTMAAATKAAAKPLLSFSTRWMRVLINRYNDGGPEALGDRRAGMERRREF